MSGITIDLYGDPICEAVPVEINLPAGECREVDFGDRSFSLRTSCTEEQKAKRLQYK